MSAGKGKGKHIAALEEQQIRQSNNNEFPGAYKKGEYIMAETRKFDWKLARIIEIRKAEGGQGEAKEQV